MLETVIPFILEIVAALVIALIGVVGAWLVKRLGDKVKLSGIATAIEQVVTAAQLTVGELQQTVVEELKTANGGKLTDNDIERIKGTLLNKSFERIATTARDVLAAASVDIKGLIQGAAEDMVREIHNSTAKTLTENKN